MSLFEVETDILRKERQDAAQGRLLREWFEHTLKPEFRDRVFPVSSAVALHTARLHVPNPAAIIRHRNGTRQNRDNAQCERLCRLRRKNRQSV